ncbi:hypothetical protein PG993_008590 [Apiospora rasikravindrae]|uniref:O-methyltransferase C-terminal domain-containing protein n=1 Tax=Apiospora rasikravindrae TaxID=990691 RepID=A0ABR1T0S9_9PEZI
MSASKSFGELGSVIKSSTTSIEDILTALNLSHLSNYPDGATYQYPTALQEHRQRLLEALEELQVLTLGPTEYLFPTFHVLYHYNIASHVPENGESISYEKLAQRCGLPEAELRRIMRAAMSLRVFELGDEEESPGNGPGRGGVRHNAVSHALRTTLAHDAVGFALEEYGPAALQYAESLRRFPASVQPDETALALANGSASMGDDIFSAIAGQPARTERVANAMSWVMTLPENSSNHFVGNVPWSPSLPLQRTDSAGHATTCPRVVVDVGGSHGDLSRALLRRYREIECVICEDLPEVTKRNLERGVEDEDESISSRLKYREYNFFTEQVVHGADVYVFRTVLHDWPDKQAIQILRTQVPALKPGARILVNDMCIEEGSSSQASGEAQLRRQSQFITILTHFSHPATSATDLMVKMSMNARERTREEWYHLFAEADPRFHIQSIISPPLAVHSIIEVVWQGAGA